MPPESRDPIESNLARENSEFTKIISQFVEGLSGRLSRMQEAINCADMHALRVSAHQLKGSGGGFGYPILMNYAAQLEQCAIGGKLDECRDRFEELRGICSRIVVAEQPKKSEG